MKKVISLLAVIGLLVGLTACGNKEGGTDKPETESDTVVLYSPHPAETINLLTKEFEEKTGIKTEVVAAGTGELLNRVEAEDGNPLGDVLWGGGAESLAAFSEFFEAYESPELANIDPVYYDPDFKWLGESPLPMILMYNTDLVAEEDVPTTWKDLLKPEFKGKIAMADPGASGSAYTIMATMVSAYGKDGAGWDFIDDFIEALEGKIVGSSGGVYKGVADGEYSIGLTLEKAAYPYVLEGAPVKMAYPEEGTTAVPDGVAIIRGAKNMENAKKFIDFALSKETQEIMASELQRRSIRNDVDAPEGLPALSDIKLVDYDFDWASNDKDANLAKWKEILIDR